MIESWRPMTWLLATLCGWSLLLLLGVLGGLGNRFPAAGDGDAKPVPLPKLVDIPERLGPFADYVEVGTRPLLSADRRPGAVPASNNDGGTDTDWQLTSVLITPRLKMAILTGRDGSNFRVKLGEAVHGSDWVLTQLEPRRAILEGPSGQRSLDLRVYDGRGAMPPVDKDGKPTAQADGSDPAMAGNADAPPNSASVAPPPPPGAATAGNQASQVEAIRRRIEARRAQMRAAAAAAANNGNDGNDNQ